MLVGVGTFSEVSRAAQPRCVVKRLRDALHPSRTVTELCRTLRELVVMRALKHPALLPCFGAARQDYDVLITCPEMDCDLAAVLRTPRTRNEMLALTGSVPSPASSSTTTGSVSSSSRSQACSRVALIGYQLLCGLAYLHDCGMIHRDVCPRNVLVSRSGHVRLADFGLVRPAFLRRTKEEQDVDERSLEWRTLKQSTIGASFYAPPDVVLDNKPHSRPADCWAVGCVLAEMVLPMVECAEAEARAAGAGKVLQETNLASSTPAEGPIMSRGMPSGSSAPSSPEAFAIALVRCLGAPLLDAPAAAAGAAVTSSAERTKNQLKMYKPATRTLFEEAAASCRGSRPLLSVHRTASLAAAHFDSEIGCPTMDALLRACRDLLSYDFRQRVTAEGATKLEAFASLVSWPLCGVPPTTGVGDSVGDAICADDSNKEGISAMKMHLCFELEVSAARRRHRIAGTDIDVEMGEESARNRVLAGIEKIVTLAKR